MKVLRQAQLDDLPGEMWMPVPGYDGAYDVSDAGRVRSNTRWVEYVRAGKHHKRRIVGSIMSPALLEPMPNYFRYTVSLRRNGGASTRSVHGLVAEAFIGPRPAGLEVAHSDGNSLNNALSNLRYATAKENAADRIRHGTQTRGENHTSAKLSLADGEEIRMLAKRHQAAKIAKFYSVHPSTIVRVIQGKRW